MLVLINWSKLILSRNCYMQKAGIHSFALLVLFFLKYFFYHVFNIVFLETSQPGVFWEWCLLNGTNWNWYLLQCSDGFFWSNLKDKWGINQQKREGAGLQFFLVFRCFAVGLWWGFLPRDKLAWVCKELTPSYRKLKFKSRKKKALHYDCFQTGKAVWVSRAGLLFWVCSVCSEALND